MKVGRREEEGGKGRRSRTAVTRALHLNEGEKSLGEKKGEGEVTQLKAAIAGTREKIFRKGGGRGANP